MKFSEHLIGLFQSIFCKTIREATMSKEIKKDYGDLVEYMKNRVMRTLGPQQVKEDVEMGNIHRYVKQAGGELFECNIYHMGNYATKIEVHRQSTSPVYDIKNLFETIEKKVKDYVPKASDLQQQEEEEVDYSSFDMQKLVEQLDIKVNVFKKHPDKYTFAELEKVKNAISDKVGEMPVSQRGKFSEPLSKIDMYVGTLKTQLSDPRTANLVGQFLGTYIPQIQSAISELAAAL